MKTPNARISLFVASCVALLISGCATVQSDTQSSISKLETKLSQAKYINSTPEAYAKMQMLPTDEPLQMLNLIQFAEKANYQADSEFAVKGWTGEQAYAEYSRMVGPIARQVGAKQIYVGKPQLTLIGAEHEKWDAVFILEYSDLGGFLALVSDPEYKKHAFHRSAAIANSRLVRMTPPTKP